MMGCGRMANLMAKGITSVPQCSTKVDGKKISFMGMALPCGRMSGNMREIMSMAKKKEKELIHIRMERLILAIGYRVYNTDMVKYTILTGKSSAAGGLMEKRITHLRPIDLFRQLDSLISRYSFSYVLLDFSISFYIFIYSKKFISYLKNHI